MAQDVQPTGIWRAALFRNVQSKCSKILQAFSHRTLAALFNRVRFFSKVRLMCLPVHQYADKMKSARLAKFFRF